MKFGTVHLFVREFFVCPFFHFFVIFVFIQRKKFFFPFLLSQQDGIPVDENWSEGEDSEEEVEEEEAEETERDWGGIFYPGDNSSSRGFSGPVRPREEGKDE